MSNRFKRITSLARVSGVSLFASLSTSLSFAGGHYSPGVEGIDAASAPPPGFYSLTYLVDYNLNKLSGAPGKNTGTVNVLAERLVWISPFKFLGADYGMETVIPLQRNAFSFNGIGFSGTSRGVGDILVGPVVLGWHGSNWDGVFALGHWFDNGHYSETNPASVGHGYRSTMLTFGGTIRPDERKLWSVSALTRLEKNGTQGATGVKPGNQLTLEWGIARQIGDGQSIGLVGYLQDQISDDSGSGASSQHSHKRAIGLEYNYPLYDKGLILKFAGYKEYATSNGASSGDLLRMTLIKMF